jgi:DNA-binding MarR family transcriptional regulator
MAQRRRTGRGTAARLTDRDYARLLAVRTGLRQFERWSAEQAASHGLTASQHQLLLAVRGHDDPKGPTIGQIAEYLLTRHHSAVELAYRAERAGLIERVRDEADQRVVRLRLSPDGERVIAALSGAHLEELGRLAALFESLIGTLSTR